MKNVTKATTLKTYILVFLVGVMLDFALFQANYANAQDKAFKPLKTAKIIEGKASKEGEAPWMAALERTKKQRLGRYAKTNQGCFEVEKISYGKSLLIHSCRGSQHCYFVSCGIYV